MYDLVTLNLLRAEAAMARHKLVTGQLTASASYEGKSVTFTQADMYKLDAYIADLDRQIAALIGMPVRRGPVRFTF